LKRSGTFELACSFCGKSQREVRKLIAGPSIYVCDECIKVCNDLIATDVERTMPPPTVATLDAVVGAAKDVSDSSLR